MDANLHDRVNLAINQTLVQAQVPGATVSVRIDGQPMLQIAAGYRDRGHAQPLAVDARFYYDATIDVLGRAKIMRPAEVCSDPVTTTSSSSPI